MAEVTHKDRQYVSSAKQGMKQWMEECREPQTVVIKNVEVKFQLAETQAQCPPPFQKEEKGEDFCPMRIYFNANIHKY